MADNPYILNFIENPAKSFLSSMGSWFSNDPASAPLSAAMKQGVDPTLANAIGGYGQYNPITNPTGLPPAGASWFDSWQKSDGFFGKDAMFGGINDQGVATQGWVSPVLGGVSSLAQSWLGMQMLDQKKEELALQKEAFGFQKDFTTYQANNQAQLLNTQMSDRQAARVGANPNAYESVGDYMKKNEVKQYG